MAEIFKWFFGIVGIVILIYVLIVVVRSVGAYTRNLATNSATSTATNTISTATIAGFSLGNFLANFHPFTVAPVNVVPNMTAGTFKEINGIYYNSTPFTDSLFEEYERNGGDNQDFDAKWGGGYFGGNSGSKSIEDNSNNLIITALKPGSMAQNYDVVLGKAHYSVFDRTGRFSIYIVDENKNIIGKSAAFVNGNIDGNGFVPWRGVLDFGIPKTNGGFVILNESKVIPVNFKFYRSGYRINRMPEMLYNSDQINSYQY